MQTVYVHEYTHSVSANGIKFALVGKNLFGGVYQI
jgi:hypothetical protein